MVRYWKLRWINTWNKFQGFCTLHWPSGAIGPDNITPVSDTWRATNVSLESSSVVLKFLLDQDGNFCTYTKIIFIWSWMKTFSTFSPHPVCDISKGRRLSAKFALTYTARTRCSWLEAWGLNLLSGKNDAVLCLVSLGSTLAIQHERDDGACTSLTVSFFVSLIITHFWNASLTAHVSFC